MKVVTVSITLCLALVMSLGCSVYMAANQPNKRDLTVLKEGIPRAHVISELGAPATTEKESGKRTDIFTFIQGYHKGSKGTRAVFHLVADVFTLGLWEIVGTPMESYFDGRRVTATVVYDVNDNVESWKLLGAELEPEPVSGGGDDQDEIDDGTDLP